jgi:hypothetical protein
MMMAVAAMARGSNPKLADSGASRAVTKAGLDPLTRSLLSIWFMMF